MLNLCADVAAYEGTIHVVGENLWAISQEVSLNEN